MPAPALDSFAGELYEQLSPLAYADPDNGYALALLCGTVGSLFQEIEDLVRDTPAAPGWSSILDVDRAPGNALGWLAQFVGVTLDPALDDTAQRARIRATDGFKRGTVAAIAGAARQYLTGAKTVIIRERDGDPYTLTVVTYTAETPDSAAVLAALTAQKPAGLILNYVTETGQDWVTLMANHATWAAVIAAYPTWNDVLNN